MDLRAGVLLLLTAQDREAASSKCDDAGLVTRIMSLAINSLKAAQQAVPDDMQTRHALADAHQLLAFSIGRTDTVDESLTRSSSISYELYRSLHSNTHTRCCQLGLSYRGKKVIGVSW